MIAELVSRSGSAASFIAVWAIGVYEFDLGAGALAVLALCNTVPRVVSSIVAGRMVDRFDPRRVLIVANVVGAVGSLLQFASPSPVLLGLASMVAGVGFGAFMPAIGSITPRLVDDDHLLPANAALELTWQIGFIVGPLAGALAIAVGGTRAPLLFDAASFVVAIACLAAVRLTAGATERGPVGAADGKAVDPVPVDSVPADGPVDSPLAADAEEHGGFRGGLRYTWANPLARYVLVLNTGMWIGISFFIVLEPLYVARVLEADAVVLGLLQTAFGTGAIVGAAVAARLHRHLEPRALGATLALAGVGMVGYTVTRSVVLAAVGVGVWGAGLGLWAPLARTMIHRAVPVSHHGRVNGVMSSLQSGLEVAPVLAAGPLADAIGVQATLIGAGVSTLALSAWGMLHREERGPEQAESALAVPAGSRR